MTTRRHPARGAPTRRGRATGGAAASAAAPSTLRRGALFLAAAAAGVLALGACRDGGRVVRDESQIPRGAAETMSRGGEVVPGGAPSGVITPPSPSTRVPPGGAGSGPAVASADWTGSIGTPGSGRLETGDPNDAQVRGVLAVLNRGELESSQIGQSKARDANVRQYAAAMVQSHQQALQRFGQGAPTGAGDLSTPLAESARDAQLRLQALPAGPDFDRTFMTQQVAMHEGALQVLGRMEQSARDASLVNEIRDVKHQVEQHLERARTLQSAVSRPPAGTSEPGLSAPALGHFQGAAPNAGAAPDSGASGTGARATGAVPAPNGA